MPSTASSFIHSLAVNKNTATLSQAAAYLSTTSGIMYLQVDNMEYIHNSQRLSELRDYEAQTIMFDATDGIQLNAIFDVSKYYIEKSLQRIYVKIFVSLLIILSIIILEGDLYVLLIVSIRKLVDFSHQLAENPSAVDTFVFKDDNIEMTETAIIFNTMTKIGKLLKIGFGDAGVLMISKNLLSGHGDLNVMNEGEIVHAIFGFCDVRQFTDTTECLQEDVMLFVNRIAFILHNIVVQCKGSANKNIGDAFLLTWKIDAALDPTETSYLADQALYAFIKTIVELERNQTFICNFAPSSTSRLFSKFPDYKVYRLK